MSLISLLAKPRITVNIGIACLSFMNAGYTDVTLAKHLVQVGKHFACKRELVYSKIIFQQFNLTIGEIGGMFFLSSFVYVLANQLCAILIQKMNYLARPLILAGFVCSALMYIISGPMFPFTFQETILYVIVRQIIFGLSIGPQMVGSFSDGSAETFKSGFPHNMATSAAFSALYTTGITLG